MAFIHRHSPILRLSSIFRLDFFLLGVYDKYQYLLLPPANWWQQTLSINKCHLSSNARVPVAQLVRASDQNSEDPGLIPGCMGLSVFFHQLFKNFRCPFRNLLKQC